MIFFTLCDCVLLINGEESKQKVVCALTTLLLYTILSFFGTKIQKILCKPDENDEATQRHATQHTRTHSKSIFINICKIILEFLKAAMVILCLREQGLNYYYDLKYTTITGLYYILSEEFYLDILCATIPLEWILKLKIGKTGNESVDSDLGRLCLYIIATTLTIVMGCGMLMMTKFSVTQLIMMFLIIVYSPTVKMNVLYLGVMREYWSFLEMFPTVSDEKLKSLEDVCPICLDDMDAGSARETPCGHVFHFTCLLRSLEVTRMCPLCKYDF